MELTTGNRIGINISSNGDKTFQAFDPSKNEYLNEKFTMATAKEFETALTLAEKAFSVYSGLPYVQRAEFLDAIADEIMELGDSLLERCSLESGLPIARISGERGRTCGQLRMFAELLREGSWLDVRIDTAQPDRKPIAKPDIRRILMPIGPVAVYGASNFPLAFSTAGGDTASALAAGCPVVVKSHSSHPGTNALVASAIIKAAKKTNMPEGVFSLLYLDHEGSVKLVQAPAIKAVGFTGSREVGLTLFNAAMTRPDPIPVYAEMSSINPVILMENALKNRKDEISESLASSVNLGVGQFCTNPGLIVLVKSDASRDFMESFASTFKNALPGTMLNKNIKKAYDQSITFLQNHPDVNVISKSSLASDSNKTEGQPIAFYTKGENFLTDKSLSKEVFGPETLFVVCTDFNQLTEVLKSLEGQLTATIHADKEDERNFTSIIQIISQKVGRLVYDGYPTGVEVCSAMQHGGPFPSTSFSNSTSVGTAAIFRFTRPVAYQSFPNNFLPEALKDLNSLKILRLINGKWTKDNI
jgi:NADP-dependent aldehyde dehydrogenase